MTARDINKDWALRLAGAGMAVFPCGPDKKPLVKWRDVSTTSAEAIAALWAQYPEALPAIDLAKCGLVVLDGDRHGGPDGRAALRELLVAQGGEYNGRATPGARTPGDGAHVYFNQNGHTFTNKRGSLPDGIDVRGNGGYVIAPYARLPDGRRYQIVNGMADLITAFVAGTIPPVPAGVAALLQTATKEPPPTEQPQANSGAGTDDERGAAYAATALDGNAAELAGAPGGGRNNKLNAVAFRMGTMVGRGWIDRATVADALIAACHANGLLKDDGADKVQATLASGLGAGEKEPHPDLADRPNETGPGAEELGGNGEDKSADASASPAPDADELQSICAASVNMKAIDWLWPDRFAFGKLGIIAGLPDEGKGQILAYIIAMITTSGLWPCDEGRAPKGKVVLLTAEDDNEDTVTRLAAAGADLTQVEIIHMVVPSGGKKERMFSLITDLDALARKIAAIGDVKLVLIDPISAYMGVKQIDSYRTNDVRSVLAPVVAMAAKLRVAFIGIMHFNKKIDVTSALLRISDSLAYGATARHVYAAIDDAENKRKLFVKAKNNLAKRDQQSLAYYFGTKMVGFDEELKKEIWAPYIEWDMKSVAVTATEAMQAANSSKTPQELSSATKFLKDFLAGGPQLQTEVIDAADANLISERTLRRAKDDLKIISRKEKGILNGPWQWALPEQTDNAEHWGAAKG